MGVLLFSIIYFFCMNGAIASKFHFTLDRCEREKNSLNRLMHKCSTIAKRKIHFKFSEPRPLLKTANQKSSVFRYNKKIGEHEIIIGAWKPDPSKSLNIINVSLLQESRGQLDYNEVSFYENHLGNYYSFTLRSDNKNNYYRIKLIQK